MNKNLIISLVALICSVFTFSACSDDDDDKKDISYPGTYKGQLEVSINNSEPLPMEQSIIINEVADGYELQLNNFSFGENVTGINIKVPVAITEAGAVSGHASDVPVIEGITAEVTISGTIVDGNADLTIDVSAPLMAGQAPVEMAVTFKGTKQ